MSQFSALPEVLLDVFQGLPLHDRERLRAVTAAWDHIIIGMRHERDLVDYDVWNWLLHIGKQLLLPQFIKTVRNREDFDYMWQHCKNRALHHVPCKFVDQDFINREVLPRLHINYVSVKTIKWLARLTYENMLLIPPEYYQKYPRITSRQIVKWSDPAAPKIVAYLSGLGIDLYYYIQRNPRCLTVAARKCDAVAIWACLVNGYRLNDLDREGTYEYRLLNALEQHIRDIPVPKTPEEFVETYDSIIKLLD